MSNTPAETMTKANSPEKISRPLQPMKASPAKSPPRKVVKRVPLSANQISQMSVNQLSQLIKSLKGKREPENIEMLSTAIETYMYKINTQRHVTVEQSPGGNRENSSRRLHTTPLKVLETQRSKIQPKLKFPR